MELYLGTAFWGWTISKPTCFELLDAYYAAGHRFIDTATNYPINKNSQDFRKAENWLHEWIKDRQVSDLKICMKVGSINNAGTPDNILTKSFLIMNLEAYLDRFGDQLHTFMIHWDNRTDENAITESLEALLIAKEKGLTPGLSGIKKPALYHKLNQNEELDFHIQIKHHLFQTAYAHYAPFHGKKRFITYGINAGGIKLDGQYQANSTLQTRGGNPKALAEKIESLRKLCAGFNPPMSQMFQLGMLYAFHHPDIRGILVGPSKRSQMDSTLAWFEQLKSGQYEQHFQALHQWTSHQ